MSNDAVYLHHSSFRWTLGYRLYKVTANWNLIHFAKLTTNWNLIHQFPMVRLRCNIITPCLVSLSGFVNLSYFVNMTVMSWSVFSKLLKTNNLFVTFGSNRDLNYPFFKPCNFSDLSIVCKLELGYLHKKHKKWILIPE